MKKTLLATAIAGAVAASGAQAATVYNEDGTQLDIYGNIQIAYFNTEENVGTTNTPNIQTTDQVADNGSTFGFAAQHVITPDLTGYLKLEFDDFDAAEKKSSSRDTGDQAYVGLRGNFGDVRLGSYDQLIDDWIQDPITNNEGFDVSDSTSEAEDINGVGVGGVRETDKVTYTSPMFGGLQFAVGTQYKGEAEVENATDSGEASFFGGAKYTMGAFSLAAVYDNLDTFDVDDAAETELGDQYGVTAQYTIDTLRLAVKFEEFDAEADDGDVDFLALGARYGYGLGDLYAAVQEVGYDDDREDRTEVILGANYSISDAMYTWAEYNLEDREDDENDGIGVGVTYVF